MLTKISIRRYFFSTHLFVLNPNYRYSCILFYHTNNNNNINNNKYLIRRSVCKTAFNKSPIKIDSPYDHVDGFVNKIRRKLGFLNIPKHTLMKSTIYMYESCTDGIDIEKFMKHCNLPDTFLTWFLVTELHVWMCMVRGMVEGKEGRVIRNQIVERMWEDTEVRLKKLARMTFSERKEGLTDLLEHFQAAIFSYDEGFLTDDKTLAAALWRILFTYENVDASVLETLVSYVRVQLEHLSTIKKEKFLCDGQITWKNFPPLYP